MVKGLKQSVREQRHNNLRSWGLKKVWLQKWDPGPKKQLHLSQLEARRVGSIAVFFHWKRYH